MIVNHVQWRVCVCVCVHGSQSWVSSGFSPASMRARHGQCACHTLVVFLIGWHSSVLRRDWLVEAETELCIACLKLDL